MNPKVSVLMPVYNAAPFLAEAIDSILAQTFADFEFVIINDGSTDGSEEIIAAYRDSRIRYLNNENNLGLVATLNRGIDCSQGQYIARMDGDDICLPKRFAKQVEHLDRNPEVGVCGTAYTYFGDSNRLESPPIDCRKAFTYLSQNSSIGHPTAMIRKSVLDEHAIRYENEFGYAADYALWVRMGLVSRIESLPDSLLRYRWHSSNMSKTDPHRISAWVRVRILWHQQLAGRELNESEKRYFMKELASWSTFQSSRVLLLSILETAQAPYFDQGYFGQLAITEWELSVIDHFRLRGLLECFTNPVLRKWSRATRTGLAAHYLRTMLS